jgi:hypothetical protein
MTRKNSFFTLLLAYFAVLQPRLSLAEQIQVRYVEGVTHGFLVLRAEDGQIIADGDLSQVAHNDRVTDHLVFRFKDGSLHEETAIFSQRGTFRLIKDRVVQKGPSFKTSSDTLIDASTGQVTIHLTEEGKEKLIRKRLDLPADVANGLMLTLTKNIRPGTGQTTVSMVVGASKPRLATLVISPQSEENFTLGTITHKAVHYVVKVELRGAAGIVAPLVGKQPPDSHIWVTQGEAPTFLGSSGPFFEDGPIWRVELAAPKPPSQ